MPRRDGAVTKQINDWTGRQKKKKSRRDGTVDIFLLDRRDGTVQIIFHDGTRRYIISSTTGKDGNIYFLRHGRYTFLFSRRDGTVRTFSLLHRRAQ